MIIQWIFDDFKYCNAGKHFAPTSMFYHEKKTRDCLSGYCKTCTRKNMEKWRLEHPIACKIWQCENPISTWAHGVRSHHRHSGFDINISNKFLVKLATLTTHCSICGRELDYTKDTKYGKMQLNSPTTDRIDNEMSLDENNVWILCKECNSTKQSRTLLEFIEYCKYVVDHEDEIVKRSKHIV